MQNNFNPYGYQPNYQPYPQQKVNTYAFVNGIEGAKSFQIMPNQMVMLLDSDNPLIYKKTANSYGQATIEAFELVPVKNDEKKSHEKRKNYVKESCDR